MTDSMICFCMLCSCGVWVHEHSHWRKKKPLQMSELHKKKNKIKYVSAAQPGNTEQKEPALHLPLTAGCCCADKLKGWLHPYPPPPPHCCSHAPHGDKQAHNWKYPASSGLATQTNRKHQSAYLCYCNPGRVFPPILKHTRCFWALMSL